MTTVKTPSWTAAQVSKIEDFANAQTDKRITNEQIKTIFTQDPLFGEKSVSMLRGKILNLGYYSIVKKTVGTAEGKAPAKRKMQYVEAIETILSAPKGSLDTFEKASKIQLEQLSNALIALSDKQDADSQTS